MCTPLLGVFLANQHGTSFRWVELVPSVEIPSLNVLLYILVSGISPYSVSPGEAKTYFSPQPKVCALPSVTRVVHND